MALKLPQNYLSSNAPRPPVTPPTPPAPKSSLQVTGSWDAAGNFKPAVVTSGAANKDYQNIQTQATDLTTSIQNQAARIAAEKAQADAAKMAKEQADAAATGNAAKIKADQDAAAAKMAAVGGGATAPTNKTVTLPDMGQYTIDPDGQIVSGPSNGKYKVGTNINAYPDATYIKGITEGKTAAEASEAQNQADLMAEDAKKAERLKELETTISGYQNGTIPLTPGEQAQVDGLKQSWQQLIDNQTLINTGAYGAAATRGYQSGSAEYDPTFSNKVIGSIVTAGQNKIADLNIKMAGEIAALIDAMREKNVLLAKQKWETYSAYSKERSDLLRKNIEDAQAKIKEAAATVQKEKEAQAKLVEDANTALQDAIKGGLASDKEALDAARAAAAKGDVAGVLELGALYLQTSTNPDIAKYLEYKKSAMAKGLSPKGFDEWFDEQEQKQSDLKMKEFAAESAIKSKEAYSSAYNTAAGKAAAEAKYGVSGDGEALYNGLKPATATAVRAKVSKFSTEPTIQNFATVQDGYNFASSLSDTTKNPADDQALIYALAKALDPGSVVREGEYATAQKYAQSWVAAYGKKVTQAIAGTGFLSEEARKNIKKTIESKYTSTKKSYDNLQSQYVEGINNLTGRSDGSKFLVDYSNPTEKVAEEETRTAVDNYVLTHPDKAEVIAKAYEVPGATDQDIYEYIQLLEKENP